MVDWCRGTVLRKDRDSIDRDGIEDKRGAGMALRTSRGRLTGMALRMRRGRRWGRDGDGVEDETGTVLRTSCKTLRGMAVKQRVTCHMHRL